jgi:hypothetical protein
VCEWCSGSEMTSDIFTKNCGGIVFEKHIRKFVGCDVYMKEDDDDDGDRNSQRESVGD